MVSAVVESRDSKHTALRALSESPYPTDSATSESVSKRCFSGSAVTIGITHAADQRRNTERSSSLSRLT